MSIAVVLITIVCGLLVFGGLAYARQEPNRLLRRALPALMILGVVVSIAGSTLVTYQPDENTRITGVPLPAKVERREYDQWRPIRVPGFVMNLLLVPSVLASPIGAAIILRAIRRQYPPT